MSYSPKTQIVSSLDAITRKYRLDPSQYYAKTELIIRLCKHRLTRAHREKQLKMSCQALHNAPPNRT